MFLFFAYKFVIFALAATEIFLLNFTGVELWQKNYRVMWEY